MPNRRIDAPNIRETVAPGEKEAGEVLSQLIMPAALADVAKFLEREPEFSYEMTGLDFGIEQGHVDQAMSDFLAVRRELRAQYGSASKLLRAVLAEYFPEWSAPTPATAPEPSAVERLRQQLDEGGQA